MTADRIAIDRRTFTLGLASGVASSLAGTGVAQAQGFPSQTIRIINPNAPGGVNDVLARLYANEFQTIFGKPSIVENRPGAGGDIGFEAVSRADPDGHTLLMGSISLTVKPAITANLKLDPRKDLKSIARVASQPMVIVLRPDFPADTLDGFIKLARENPNKFSYGTPGHGTPQHFGTEMLCSEAGIKMKHVPYRGAAPAMMDLTSSHIDFYYGTETSAGGLIKEGKMKAVAGTGSKRLSLFPQVKTLAELGYPKSVIEIWYGVFGPPGLPDAITDQIISALRQIEASAEYRTKLKELAIVSSLSTPAELHRQLETEIAQWRSVGAAAGIKPE